MPDNGKVATLFFDGASKGNPGLAGAGAVLFLDSYKPQEIKRFLGKSVTNNRAEYAGLIVGLEAAREMGATEVKVYGDSKLVVMQMLGKWKIKDEKLKKLNARAVKVARSFAKVTYNHIPREQNEHADLLSNHAVAAGIQGNLKVSVGFKSIQ